MCMDVPRRVRLGGPGHGAGAETGRQVEGYHQYCRVLQLGASAPGTDGLEAPSTFEGNHQSRGVRHRGALGRTADVDIKHQAYLQAYSIRHEHRRRSGPCPSEVGPASWGGAGYRRRRCWCWCLQLVIMAGQMRGRADVHCIAGLAARGGRALGSESECNERARDGRPHG